MPSGTCRFRCTSGRWISQFGAPTSISTQDPEGSPVCSSMSYGMTLRSQSEENTYLLCYLSRRPTRLLPSHNRFAGWWGHDLTTRFAMPTTFSPIRGAKGFQQSNPCILAIASLRGSLKIFKSAGMMQPVRERSIKLTGGFERLLRSSQFFIPLEQVARGTKRPGFSIITPSERGQRGAQLSLLFLPVGSDTMKTVFKYLSHHGVIGDEREPDVIRLSPAPLYNTLADCERAVQVLDKVLGSLQLREYKL